MDCALRLSDRPHVPAAAAVLILSLSAAALAAESDVRILFTGDLLLSRQVRRELDATARIPDRDLGPLFASADLVGGNLEGAVGSAIDCVDGELCFDVRASDVALLASAGFRVLSVENNHAADLGDTGRDATTRALRQAGLEPLTLDRSPLFLRVKGLTLAFVAFSEVAGRDGRAEAIPSALLAQKLRLARSLAQVVIVSVHWGEELFDWPSEAQRRDAAWLVEHGADVVMGHHPHVVQEPECVLGKPVFFSLGNHLFDQKYPLTKVGLIADCSLVGGVLRCGGIRTRTPPGSAMPEIDGRDSAADAALSGCPCEVHGGLTVGGIELSPDGDGNELALQGMEDGRPRFATPRGRLLGAEPATLPGGAEVLFTVEEHPSTIDGERAPRPYVYRVTPTGLAALWRGSALAWPLVDAVPIPGQPGCLCALHRGDSFLLLDPSTSERRTAVYRWNGFGFDALHDADLERRCRDMLLPAR